MSDTVDQKRDEIDDKSAGWEFALWLAYMFTTAYFLHALLPSPSGTVIVLGNVGNAILSLLLTRLTLALFRSALCLIDEMKR